MKCVKSNEHISSWLGLKSLHGSTKFFFFLEIRSKIIKIIEMHSRSRSSRSCAFHCRGTEWSMRKWCISENISPVSKFRHSKQESQNLMFAARWTVSKSWTFIICAQIYHSIHHSILIVHQFQRTFCHESIGLKEIWNIMYLSQESNYMMKTTSYLHLKQNSLLSAIVA